MVEKFIKDGKIAVLYSPGYGAGWYTWNEGYGDVLVFDKDIVAAVLEGDNTKAEQIAEEKCPDAYLGGAHSLKIMWLNPGDEFEITEYDGSESVHVIGSRNYLIA